MAAPERPLHSRSLFITDLGPMRFYVRPGPLKRQLSPLVTHGGGIMCRVQEPGAFLLAEPGQVRGIQYLSSHYITDCVRSNRRLSPQGYRLLEGPLNKRPRIERKEPNTCCAGEGSAGASPTSCDLRPSWEGPGEAPHSNPIGEAFTTASCDPITPAETPVACGPNTSAGAPALSGLSHSNIDLSFCDRQAPVLTSCDLNPSLQTTASSDLEPSTTEAPPSFLPRASVRKDGPGAKQIVDSGGEAQKAGAESRKRPTTSDSLSLGRQPFSRQEDIAILEYVLENEGPKRTVTGTLLWKELEQDQLLRRTWQAMKCRYTRYIMWHKHLYKPPPRVPGQTPRNSTDQQGDPSSAATTIAQHHNLPVPNTTLKSPQQDPPQSPDLREVASGSLTSKEDESAHPGGRAETPHLRCTNRRATDVTLKLAQETAGPSYEGEEVNIVSAAAVEARLSPQENLEADNSGDLQIFKLANMEFEVDDENSGCQVKVPGISLKDFVMGEDSESANTQMQEDDVTSSPDSEGLQDALTDMMREFSLDICQVTQALLKNNGEVGSTRYFLRTGRRPDGFPIWEHKDDVDLQNSDAVVRPQMARKYGADNVAKRVAFLAG